MENLGKKAKDKITGFEGIIIGYCHYLFGCNTYGISPQILKDGKKIETEWFDEGRIEIIGAGITVDEVKSKSGTGAEYHENPS
jgi:hypothetical protein